MMSSTSDVSNNKCPSGLLGLRHLALWCQNLMATEKFYVTLLGFKVVWRPDADNVYLSSSQDNLALHQLKSDSIMQTERGQQRLDHLGIAIATPEAVSEWFEFLQAHEVEMLTEVKHHRDGAVSFYCRDPEGNVVQMIYHESFL